MNDQSNASDSSRVPILDRAAALETTGGDTELADILLTTCIEDAPNIIAEAKSAVSTGDWVTARRCGHSLKSSFGAVGALAAARMASQLEFIEMDDAEQFSSAIELVESALSDLVSAAKSL